MNIPVNFIAEDLPQKQQLIFAVPPEKCHEQRKYVYILTDSPQLFPKEFIDKCDGIFNDLNDITPQQMKESIFYIYFSRGDFYLKPLERIIKDGGRFVSANYLPRIPFWMNNFFCIGIYNQITYLLQKQPMGSIEELSALMQAVEQTRNLEGDYVEIGVFSGSSALAALLYMQRINIKRKCYLLDTYTGFNYETAKKSPDMKWDNTHFSWKGFSFKGQNAIDRIKGLTACTGQDVKAFQFDVCCDDLPNSIKQIAMANLDVDLYEVVLRGLQILAPLMAKGGIITIEDPTCTHSLAGAYYALHEFLESNEGRHFINLRTLTTHFLIKK